MVIAFIVLVITALTLIGVERYTGGRIWDWGHFYYAAEALTQGNNPYESGERGYIYPVSFAWLIQPLLVLGFEGSAAAFILVMGICCVGSVLLLERSMQIVAPDTKKATVSAAVLIGFILVSDKFNSTLTNSQTDGLLIFCFAVALYYLRSRAIWAGLAIALAASLKYHALLFIVLFFLRGHWRAGWAGLLGFVSLMLVPALTVGWGTNLGYLADAFGGLGQMLANTPLVRSGADLATTAAIAPISWERSISLTSAFARLADWLPDGFGYISYGVLLLLMACVAGVCAAGYYRAGINPFGLDRARSHEHQSIRIDACDFALILTVIIVFAPQSTARHFIYALPTLSLVALTALNSRSPIVKWGLLGGSAAFCLALNLPLSQYPDLMNAWRSWSVASWILLFLTIALPFFYLRQFTAPHRAK